MIRQPLRVAVSILVTVGLVVGVVVLVRASEGAFSGYYPVAGVFPSAGTGLHLGSEVDYRGVQVGRVSGIDLVDRQAKVTMLIEPSFRIPESAVATITPQNVFGAEEVAFATPRGLRPPWVAPGGTITRTKDAQSLTDLFAAAAPLLQRIDRTKLSAVVGELAQATAGEGPEIAAGFNESAKLATLLSSTIDAQLAALDSFTRLSGVLAPTGTDFNELSGYSEQVLPAFNAAAGAYRRLISSFTAVAGNLTQYLTAYHPDIAALITNGASVARVFLAHESDVENLIHGLYRYIYKFANGLGPAGETLPDGSRFAYFKTFILFSDVNTLACDLIAPAGPRSQALAALEPLQQAIEVPGSPFDCAAQIAAFDAAQGALTTGSGGGTTPTTTTPTAPGETPQATAATAQAVIDQATAILATPQGGGGSSLAGYVSMLMGGTP